MDTSLPPPNASEPERPFLVPLRRTQSHVLRGVVYGMLFECLAAISGWILFLSSHRVVRSLIKRF